MYHTAPVQPAVSSPQLAMAQAHVQPIPLAPMPTHQTGPRLQPLQYTPQPTYQAPPRPMQQVMYAQAPLPELEPMRAYRLPTTRGSARPIAEVMVSERAAQLEYEQQMDGQEIRRALAPLAPTPIAYAPANAWVSSPTTAMYTPGTR
ncbi:MAG: hypothetical protein LBJ46_06550 [Planctomycetota bacterium]|nr:hypothetical protein [Planctomycetota bacterium]